MDGAAAKGCYSSGVASAGPAPAAEAAPEELSTIANIMVAPPMPFVPEVAHGKLIIFELAGGGFFTIHLGMTGQTIVAPARPAALQVRSRWVSRHMAATPGMACRNRSGR